MSDAAFGAVTTPVDVEEAVVATIRTWHWTYLQFLARHQGLESKAYPPIASYRAADTMEERFIEQQIPAIQVMLTVEDSIYTQPESAVGHFNGLIDVLVQGPTPEDARRNAITYAFAIGLLLSQHRTLDGSVKTEGLRWASMGAPAVGKPDARWLALGSSAIEMTVHGLFNPEVGPYDESEAIPAEEVAEPADRPKVATHKTILDPEAP